MKSYWVLFIFIILLLPALSPAQIRTEMNLANESFLSPAYDATPKHMYQFLGAELISEESTADEVYLNLKAAYAFGAPLASYINLREFYYIDASNDQQRLLFGRKKMNWSSVDRRWNLGVWEPVFKWNPLESEGQGLTGLFYENRQKSYSLTLFASYFYMPNQGASFEINANGEFVRGNPWFQQPPDSIRVLSEVSKIEYHFLKPNEAQIVLQPSYGALVDYGDPENVLFRASFIYKPMNNLALGYNGLLDIPNDRGSVEIYPQVVYHNLSAADITWKTKAAHLGLGILLDRPNKDKEFDVQWTTPEYNDSILSTLYIDIPLQSFVISLQRLQVQGELISEVGTLASASRPAISSQYPYREANQIALQFDRGMGKRQYLSSHLSYTQSSENEFRLIRINGKFKFDSRWSAQAEMQLVDAAEMTKANKNEIAPLVNNDRLVMGVSYVF